MKTQFAPILLCLLFFGGCSAQNIDFFSSANHQGTKIHTSTIATTCEELPTTVQTSVLSVDPARCVRLFSSNDCDPTSKYVEINNKAGGANLGSFANSALSFQACTEVESDVAEKRIKIYGENQQGTEVLLKDHVINPAVCNAWTTAATTAVVTEACVILYDGETCTGTSLRVEGPPEGTPPSRRTIDINARTLRVCNVEDFKKAMPVEEIIAKVVTIKFTVDSEAAEASKLLKDSIEGEEVFSNNGNVQVSQRHSSARRVKEVLNMLRPNGILQFDEVSVSPTVTITSPEEIPVFAMDKLNSSFRNGFTLTKGNSGNERFREVTDKVFDVDQDIQVAPCTNYKLSSIVNVVQGYPVDYEIEAEIEGEIDNVGMNENQLKARLHGLEYVSTRNNSGVISVIAKSSGSLTVDFGTGIEITGEGSQIEGCEGGVLGGAGAVSQSFILSVSALAGLAIYYLGRLA